MIDKQIKKIKYDLNTNKVISGYIMIDKKPLDKLILSLEETKEFNCTKNNLGNLANHLEDGKEYVILVKEVDSNK